MLLGIVFVSGCNDKQTTAIPAAEQETKLDPESKLAAIKIESYAHPDALISVYQLKEKILDPEILVFDARGRTFRIYQQTYLQSHIPGALPILYSNYYNQAYPGRMAFPLEFQSMLGKSGVSNNTSIVLYGGDGLEARLYWAIKMYGYDDVKILDGGLDKWKESGGDTSNVISKGSPVEFKFDLTNSKAESMLATLKDVKAAVSGNDYFIVDARSDAEYAKGHIPGSMNIPSTLLFNKDMTFKPSPQLRELFESKKITQDKTVIVYSNVGVRSSLVWFALSELLGYPNVKNYDGSYNEWLEYKGPVATGL
ncbi:sulfurtransferase [Pelotomaculum terephthalicicum JT]|uniref:sulfurtransferase n=1 Tax=Pelotomaculum TaxID=191373 RepID=UPI0009D3F458|nr:MULTISPECIES: sulfurtransferase [Pelotomaculum]MCG9969097.1 sulfurtransferase [Pelotomaculum terephthalicicum JT]OPX86103.1 MAG: putative thiosulfate sulfurtransferase [Pelotomaculum sp. PtaB.Bin117]OPY60146.1 MAG: putative thiosulfate sulfurtransferase [Pelotomaculum sp. PtaU1.Bin065]